MPSKEKVCFQTLKEYGFLIDGPKSALTKVKSWPKAKSRETFKRWKDRAFGKDVTIFVYQPYEPAPQTRMSTLMKNSGGEHLQNIFVQYSKSNDKRKKKAVIKAEQEVEKQFLTFPAETLRSILRELGRDLQPSVEEFIGKYIMANKSGIDTEDLLRKIITAYNSIVSQNRKREKL